MTENRNNLLNGLLRERILVLDGAMGTMIQGHGLEAGHYHGERFHDHGSDQKGNNDLLTLTQPQIIRGIHASYLDAGADIVETNTFNSNAVSMIDYGMTELVYELNVAGARLARSATDEFSARTPGKPRFVAACSARPAAPRRSRRTSTTRASATSRSTNSWPATWNACAAWWTAASTC